MTFDEHIKAIREEYHRQSDNAIKLVALQRVLRRDHGLDASWDGLRHSWNIELTPGAIAVRDERCKLEADLMAENASLRRLVRDMYAPPLQPTKSVRELGIEVDG